MLYYVINPLLYESLEQITNESHDDYSRRANGVLALLQRFDTFLGLKLSHLVFTATEQCSNALQGKITMVQEALQTATLAQSFLSRQREDNSFSSFYKSTVLKVQEYNIEPVLPQYRRPPTHIDGGSIAHRFVCPSDFFKVQYFEALDLIQQELSRRFNQQSLALPKKIEEMMISSSNGLEDNISVPAEIIEAYSQDLDMNKLQCQLQMLPDLVSAYKRNKSLPTFRVTTMRTISEMLSSVPSAKDLFSEVDKMIRIYLSILVTTATAERSFSLCRIKTYLRSTMSEQRLNNVMLLHVHRELTNSLDHVKIAECFVRANSRRLGYFGHF